MATIQRPTGVARRRETKWERAFRAYKDGDPLSVMHRTLAINALSDATATTIGTLTIPNVQAAGGLQLTICAALGDGDAAELSMWTIAISRIPGAATKAVLGTKGAIAATVGAVGNAAVTVTAGAVVGANTGPQTIAIQVAVARSAGAAANHDLVANAQVYNVRGGGIIFS
jgi:hypothetical protein